MNASFVGIWRWTFRAADAGSGEEVARFLGGVRSIGRRDFIRSASVSPAMLRPTALMSMPPDAEAATVTIDTLYREHADAMYRVAVSIVRDHALAEDVVHESIIRAWRHVDSFRGESSWKTWLLRITHNTAISMLRRLRDAAIDPLDIPDVPGRGLEDDAIEEAFIAAFEAALFDLDDLSRSIVALREIEAMPYEDIASVLNTTEAVVKTRLYRARHSLAHRLADWSSREAAPS